MTPSPAADNPLLASWQTPHETPPFDAIQPAHYLPALEAACAAHQEEIAAIADGAAPPTFGNVIIAMERAGKALHRVSAVFWGLVSAHSNPDLLVIEGEFGLRLTRHWNAIHLNGALFARIKALYDARASLGLNEEQGRLLERAYLNFHRAGAGLDEASKTQLAQISERLSQLGTQFSQNVLADERDWMMALSREDEAGLPDHFIASAREEAKARGVADAGAVTLSRSSAIPFLQLSPRRDLREKVFKAFASRGDNHDAHDNNALIAEMVKLRADYARLMGYATYADFKLADSMAKTPQAARALLERVWHVARARALKDRDALQDLIAQEGGNFALAPWDWRYYEEKLRARKANFDEAQIKPYFTLDNMIAAAFDTAHRLFGITFVERKDVPVWHADVRVWEVVAANGKHLGLFYGDYFARPSKRSGAWMTSLRDQQKLDGDVAPLIINVCNFAKGAAGEPALLSPDDARTLFHEMGHGLHGLLSNVTYPSLAGTAVYTDFVELPSQLYEHWQERPEVLRRFARHYKTGEALPDDLLARFLAARKFGQGFATVEYVASALIDMAFHTRADGDVQDVRACEAEALQAIGMPDEILPRHRPQHFGHLFSGDGYAAGYYSYMWSEVMDADAFGAFEEAGNVFDSAVARKLYDNIYSSGGSRDPEMAYAAFRGRAPAPEALLRRRGLADEAA